MAYKLTPEQYKDAAQRRISNQNTAENTNSAVSAYARALHSTRALDNKNKQATETKATAPAVQNHGTDNWILQLGATIGELHIRPLEGLAKFAENSLLDFTAGLIATGLDFVGADEAAKDVQDFAAQDFVGQAFDWEPIQAIYDSSFSNEWGSFGEILQEATYSVGEQAVPFLLNFVPGGPVLSQIAFAQGAYGGAFEAASQDGGSVLGASSYAAVSAAMEWGIERLTGGVMNAKWGKSATDGLKKVIGKVAKGPIAQKIFGKVFDMAGEGAEEVLSGMLENYVKAMTYKADTSSVEAYINNILTADPATAEELMEQFLVGAVSAGFMGGAADTIKAYSPSMQFSDTYQEMEALREKARNLNEKGKDTTAVEAEIAEKEAELAEIVNKNKYRFQNGDIKQKRGYKGILPYMDNYYEKDGDGNYGVSRNALIHHQNVSYGATQVDVDNALKNGAGGVIHEAALKGKAAEARTQVDTAVKNLNKHLKGQRLSVVIADINQTAKEATYGYIDKTNRVIVLDARYLGTEIDFKASDGKVYKVEAGMSTLLHEVFHDVENTKAGDKLKKTLAKYAKENSRTKFDLSSESEKSLTNEDETQYSRRRTPYSQWKSNALAWANDSRTQIGDMDSGSDSEYAYFYEAIDPDGDGRATDYKVVAKVSYANENLINEWNEEVKQNNERNHASVHERIIRYERAREEYQGYNAAPVGESSRDGRANSIYQGESQHNGKRDTQESRRNIRESEGVTDIVAEVKEVYPDADAETLQSELAARQLENLLLNERVIHALTQDNSTLAKRILRGAERLLASLKGEKLAETKDLERILNKTIKLYNKAIVEKGKGQTVKAKSLDKKEEKEYDGIKNSRRVEDGREEDGTDGREEGKTKNLHERERGGIYSRGIISYTDDAGRVQYLRETTGREELEKRIKKFSDIIYTGAHTGIQESLKNLAKNEDIKLYFAERLENAKNDYIRFDDIIIIKDDATEKEFVDILNKIKPIQRDIDYTKIAKISQKRWDSFLAWKPDAYITRIPIQQFLDMTTESYVDQRSINALASQYAKNTTVEDIKNSYKDAIYLEIDIETGKVTDHEGRHRLTQLLNAGNGYVDVFVISRSKADFESKNSLKVKGQFNDNVYSLGLVRANSQRFSAAIEATFKKDDGNIRYSRRVTHTQAEIKAAAQKGKGQTVKSKSLDKREEKEYDNDTQHSRRISDDGRKENRENGNEGAAEESKIRRARDNSRWRGISYTDDGGRIRQLYGIVGDRETVRKVENFAEPRYSFRSSKTGMANDKLSPYNEELKGVIVGKGDYIIDSFEKLEKIVALALDERSKQATAYFGIIDAKHLQKIKNNIPNLPKVLEGKLFKEGQDYSIAVTLDSIRHIVEDKSGLTREDVVDYLDRLADTVMDFDNVSFDYYTDSYNQKHKGILFKKKFADGTFISFNLVSNRKKSLALQSLYMDKVDYQKKKSAETLLMQDSLSRTPKVGVGQTSTNSIREENEKVNTFEKNSSENISNDDIRYSRRVTHTQAEIKAATEDMVELLTVAGDINEDLFDVSTRKNYDLKRITADINNLAAQGKLTEKSKPVKQLVEAIIDGTVLTEHYAGDLREQVVLLDTLRPFLHSMNFQEEGIKAELQHKYGKENNVFRLWGKKSDGATWDSVVQEITEIMPMLKKDSDLETLFNIIDSYTQAVADMKRIRHEARSFLSKANNEIETEQSEAGKFFAKQLDAWDGQSSNKSFVLGRTSDVLKSIGIEDREIRFDSSKIKKILSEHKDMSIEILRQVPSVLESPVLIMKSKTVEGRVVLFGEIYDKAGKPVIVALELNPTSRSGEYINIIKVASAYGRNNTQHLIETSEILYIDKKRADIWSNVNRLQLPLLDSNINSSTTIIHKNSEKSTQNAKKVDEIETDNGPVFEIQRDSELAERIKNSTKSKYTVIKEYLVEKFGDTEFSLSDGKKAIMDNSDAEKLKYNADEVRIAELSQLKELVEKASIVDDNVKAVHKKFDAFSYYKIKIAYDGDVFEILFNVGRAKNDGKYHIYAITSNNERAAGRASLGLSSPVGHWIKNDSYTTIIHEKSEKSTQNAKKVDDGLLKNGIKPFNPVEYDYKAGLKAVSEMENVADLKGDEFPLGGEKVYHQVAEYFNSIGNEVYNDLLGNIELTKRGAKDSISHGLGRKKAAAFKAVPAIIQQGNLVDYQTNWKGRGYDTAVISAPVSIEGESYYAAVVVRRTKDSQRFYLHEIDIEKKASRSTKATTAKENVSSAKELGGSPFINSIFEKIRNVNSLDENYNKELKSKLQPRSVDDGLSEIKSLMAKQLIVSLSEQGTELVTKVTAERLEQTLKTERKEIQKALRAIKNGDKTVSLGDLELPQSARNQLEELSQSIVKERAAVEAERIATALVNDLRKDLTATEISDLKKNVGYQLIFAYVTEKYAQDGKAPSMEAVRTEAAALYEALRRDVSDVKQVREALKYNEKVFKQLHSANYEGLRNQIRTMTAEDTYIEALDGFLDVYGAMFNADGDLRSFNEIIKKGLLKKTIIAFEEYFKQDNPVLSDMVESGEFENIKSAVQNFKEYVNGLKGFKDLSLEERTECLNGCAVFLGAITRAVSPEKTVTINGKTVSAKKYARKAIRTLDASQKRKKNGGKIEPKRGLVAHFEKYLYHIVRPNVMIEIIENSQYSDYRELGGLTGAYEEIRSGSIKGANKRLDLESIITSFWNDKKNKVGNKKYFNHLRKDMVKVSHSKGEVEMSKGEALGLYLTLRQSDGFRHADADNPTAKGIFFDLKGSIVNYAYGGEALKFTNENFVELEASLKDKDKRFIKVVEQFMSEAAIAKGEVDTYFFGQPRLLGEDYYPLLTDETGKDKKIADKVQYYNPLDPVGHLSINQSRMGGMKALRVRNVIDTLTAYAEAVGMYYGVAIPIDTFRTIYEGKSYKGQSLKDYIHQNISSQFKEDIEKLLLDIQGAQDVPDGFWEKRRSKFAAFQILFNPKTPFKQMSGILTLAAGLKNSSVGYGLAQTAKVFKKRQAKFDFAEMYKYCPATRVRYADHQATLANANTETLTNVTRLGGAGIELVDKWTVWIAWEACKKEVGAIDGKKNDVYLLEKAGKLLNKTLDNIDRFEITERIEFSRSPSMIKRSLAMFGSSSQAMLSQFVKHTFALSQRYYEKKHLPEMIERAKADLSAAEKALQKAIAVYEQAKVDGDKAEIRKAAYILHQAREEASDCKALISELNERQTNIDKEIKRESLYTKKTIAAISASIVAAALISEALQRLLGDKEEENENFLMSVFDETLSSIFGLFPGLGQMYNALELDLGFYEKKSYDVSFWLVDEWQAFADAVNGITGLMDGSGTKTPARVLRDWAYFLGQWYGIPFRNAYNTLNGFLNVTPSWDYWFNNLFGKGNYASDLQKAVKAGDTELAETIVGLMLKDDGGEPDTKVVKTIRSLYEQGHTGVIPRTVSASVAIDGETYDMTSKQQKRFKQLYSQADEKIERLIGKQSFVNLSARVQADSIKWIYDYYYQLAKYDLAGIEDDSKKALFGSYIDVETLAVAYSYCRSLEADTDKNGKAITGSRKQKIVKYLNSLKVSAAEKYMILGYLGYSPVNQNAKTFISNYARRSGADSAEIKELLEACNIAA